MSKGGAIGRSSISTVGLIHPRSGLSETAIHEPRERRFGSSGCRGRIAALVRDLAADGIRTRRGRLIAKGYRPPTDETLENLAQSGGTCVSPPTAMRSAR